MSWPALNDLARLPLPGLAVPGSIAFSPDGSALTYLHATDGSLVRSLWWHDLATGERWVIAGPPPATASEAALSHDQRLRRERTRTSELGVTEYAWADAAPQPTLVVPIPGRVFVAAGDQVSAGVRPLAGVEGASCAIGSPDGGAVAFVRDGDLWVVALDGGPPLRLTDDAEPGVFNGLAEYVAAEELHRFEGLWWSANSRSIAYAHVDERPVPPFVIAHPDGADPAQEEHRYPFAGGPNARVSLRVVTPGGASRDVRLPMADGDYLARVVAEPAGGWLAAVLPRAQRALHWLRVTAAGGAEPLWTERAEPWINLDDDTRALGDGRILRSTERTGFRHLELRTRDGLLERQLTAGAWVVVRVVHVDEERGEVLFLGTRHGATERRLYAVPLDARRPSSRPVPLTAQPGCHDVTFSHDGSRWVDTWSTLDRAPQVDLHRRDEAGEPRRIHPSGATAGSLGIRPPELLKLTAADGTTPLQAALYRPARADTTPYPCVVWVYGGPHAQSVRRAWDVTVHPLRQYLSRAGAAVLVVDNRGTAFRGLAFEAPLRGALGRAEVADQAAAVRQLAERGIIDPGRVAITGGSYGGYMTLRAMALEPELFRVGVAVAPVTAWDGYDTTYTERYLGDPALETDAYRSASLLDAAAEIVGEALLIHGAIDENVHLRHSTRLLAALRSGDRDVELVIMPRDRHRARTPDGLRTRDRRTVVHLLTGLGLPLDAELTTQAETAPAAEARAEAPARSPG
ncbi:MAG: DPP IV N-terminal domain-containing protein [Candidatus Limnocylindria bacterium]